MQLNIAKFSCNFRSLYVTNVRRALVGFSPVKVYILVQQITYIICHSGQKRNKGIKCPTCFSEVSGRKVFFKIRQFVFFKYSLLFCVAMV